MSPIVRKPNKISGVRSRFDDAWERALLRGNLAALSFLIVGALAVVLIGATILALTDIDINAEKQGFIHSVWELLLRAISPDQLTDQDSWSARMVLLLVTLFGLLLFSTLVSISNSTLSQRLEGVRRGRRPVDVQDHIAILNWNEFGYRVLREIAEANVTASATHKVSILCDQDPLELMRSIEANFLAHARESRSKWFRNPDNWVTIRRGLGHHTEDLLNLAAIDKASGAIVLHEEETDDSQVVRCVLAIGAALRSRGTSTPYLESLLPVITFNSNSDLAHSLDFRLTTISKSTHKLNYRHINYIPLSPEEIRVGIETQVARHRGLSYVYQDLLDFGGEELYILEPPHGISTFGEAFCVLEESIPLGVLDSHGANLWPDWSLQTTSVPIIVLAHDKNSAGKRTATATNYFSQPRGAGHPLTTEVENFLFVGWNESSEQLRLSLPDVIAPGSQLTVILRKGDRGPTNLQFGNSEISTCQRDIRDPLDDAKFLEPMNHAVVFADMNVSAQQSDAQVLTDLLACRHYADHIADPTRRFTIVGELRRRSSRYVAGVRLADDLLVSESLMAAAATQLVFEPRIEGIINALLSKISPVELISVPLRQIYDRPTINWLDLRSRIANSTGEIAIGVRTILNGDPVVKLNPTASMTIELDDEIVLLSKKT